MSDGYHIRQSLFAHREWMDRAECKKDGVDPDWFHAELTSAEKGPASRIENHLTMTEKRAKAVCLRCPVRDECLRYCLEDEATSPLDNHGAGWGIWGGTLPRERRRAYAKTKDAQARFAMLTLLVTMQGDDYSKKGNPQGLGLMGRKA